MSEYYKKIILTKIDFYYLKNSNYLLKSLHELLESCVSVTGEKYSIAISEDISEEFRSAFTERLAQAGFGPNFELSSEGMTLETLIDKFAWLNGVTRGCIPFDMSDTARAVAEFGDRNNIPDRP